MAKAKKVASEASNRKDKLHQILQEVNKSFGETIINYGVNRTPREKIPFGIEPIDKFIGGGVIQGNFTIVYGGTGVGKSTLAYCNIAEAQKIGKTCVYIDLEHGYNEERAKQFGVIPEELLIIENATSAEQVLDIIIKLCREQVVDLIVLDSVQALTPLGEQESKKGKELSIEHDDIALLAKKLGKFLRIVNAPLFKSKVALLLIGQVRTEGIGTFATREGLTGGYALKHYPLLILYLRKGSGVDAPTEKYKDEDGKTQERKIGFSAVLKIEKSKIDSSPEGSEIRLPFYFKSGFNHENKQ